MLDLQRLEQTVGVYSKGLDILGDPGGYIGQYTNGGSDLLSTIGDFNIPIISDLARGGSSFLDGVTNTLTGGGSSFLDQRADEFLYPEYGQGDAFRNSGGSYASTQRRYGPPGKR